MSLATAAIFQGYDQNILQGAVITSSPAPSATYSLLTLGFLRPDMRVRFGSGTVTVTFTVGSSKRGDILVIPMSNLVSGVSPTVVSLTNGAGLNVPIATSGSLRNGLPKTIVVDLSLLDTNVSNRTSTVWNLVIVGNPSNVTLGGAIAIYGPKTALADRDFQWGYTPRKRGALSETVNEYLTRYQLNMQSMERSIDLQTLATDTDADALEAWFDANNGRGLPGLLWLTPEVEDAFLGCWQETFERIVDKFTNTIKVSFTELSKGIPLL